MQNYEIFVKPGDQIKILAPTTKFDLLTEGLLD